MLLCSIAGRHHTHARVGTEEETITKSNSRICQFLVADQSGSVSLSLWDSNIDPVVPGTIIRLTGGCGSLSLTHSLARNLVGA